MPEVSRRGQGFYSECKFLIRLLCPWIIISVLKSLISFKSTVDLCHFLMPGRQHPSKPLRAFIRFFVVNIGCSTWVREVLVFSSPWVFSLLYELTIRQILSEDIHFTGFSWMRRSASTLLKFADRVARLRLKNMALRRYLERCEAGM